MLSTKNIFNQSTLTANNISTSTIQSVDRIYENVYPASADTLSTPFFPYTLDYSTGSVFYIPTDLVATTNFNVIIQNVPADTSKIYNITLMYYQSTSKCFCNGVRIVDTQGTYILGTSSTFGTTMISGGTPVLNFNPNLIIQQFSVISIPTSAGVMTRYVVSSVINNY